MLENIINPNERKIAADQLKQEYTDLLLSTGREGVEKLLEYLNTRTDFFTAPAAAKFHNNFEGGLLEHSLNVYRNFKDLLAMKNIEMEQDSIIITALLHDLCKCNYYIKEERNRKVNGKWESYETWGYVKAPTVLLPHSQRSIRIIRNFIPLKFVEELTIFYHMGPFGGEDYEYRNLLQAANSKYPQTLLFYIADLISSYMDEHIVE